MEVANDLQGGHCIKIVCSRADGRWGPGIGQTGVVQVKSQQWYELSFRARQEGLRAGIIVALRNITDWNANHLWEHVFPDSEWRSFTFKFQAPYDLRPTQSRLQFSFDSSGTLWLDDVSLVETTKPRSPNLVDVGHTKNRVPNSSFELGSFDWGTYGTTFLVGEIDASTAYHGYHSFRLDVAPERLPLHWNDFTYALRGKPTHAPPPNVALVTRGYLPVIPNGPLLLSAYVKADRPGGTVRLGIVEEDGTNHSTSVEVGTNWKRVMAAAKPHTEMAFVRFELLRGDSLTPPTSLWVDAVQLEAAEAPTDYQPALPVEIGFAFPREDHLYHVHQPAPLTLLAYNTTDTPRTVDLTLYVENFFQETVAQASRRLSVPGGAVVHQQLGLPTLSTPPPPTSDPGFYRLHATWQDPAGPQERKLRFAIIHPLSYQDTFLGQNHAFVTDQLMRLTHEVGTTWVRSWFVRWDDIEPTPGQFDFSEADAHLQRLEDLGFHVQLVIPDPSSEWASTAPTDLTETTGEEAESRRVWWLPGDMQAFENYVAALFARYGTRVKCWEIFNEPVTQKGGPQGNLQFENTYPRFIEAVRHAAQRAGVNVQLMGAGLTYLKDIQDLSPLLSAIDILSEHRYPGLGPASAFQDGLRQAIQIMHQHNVVRPIWLTEYGIYADDDPDPTTLTSRFLVRVGENSERLAATAAIKHQIVALANGTEKIFFHIGNWPITLNREHSCGFHPFFEWSGLPRKMLVTENVLVWATGGTSFKALPLHDQPPVMVYEFRQPQNSTFVLWATQPTSLNKSLTDLLDQKVITAYNIVGQQHRTLTQIDEYPTYLRVASPYVALVRQTLAEWAART
ncbi:MAG: endo-1,4-beta-xylanase [Candidatus Zipacnadales bacterium]